MAITSDLLFLLLGEAFGVRQLAAVFRGTGNSKRQQAAALGAESAAHKSTEAESDFQRSTRWTPAKNGKYIAV